jgi:uncharacterized membrane protein
MLPVKPMLLRLLACTAVAVGALMATTSASLAQFEVCNQSSVDEIYVAIGLYKERKGWESEGWYTVARGECATLVERMADRYYYLYAENGKDVWDGTDEEGSSNFCVDPEKVFTLNVKALASKGDNPDCEKRGYITKRFRRVDTERYGSYTYNFGD